MSAVARAYQLARDFVRKLNKRKVVPPPTPRDAKKRAHDAKLNDLARRRRAELEHDARIVRKNEELRIARPAAEPYPEDEITLLTGDARRLITRKAKKRDK